MTNGVPIIQIGSKGKVTFQFEGGQPFVVDIVATYNDWAVHEEQFFETQPDGVKKLKDVKGYYDSLQSWVSQMAGVEVTQTQAGEFLKHVYLQQEKMADFFDIRRHRALSSAASSGSTVSDSTPGAETSSGPASPASMPGKSSIIFEREPLN
jgi:hypothetical protein